MVFITYFAGAALTQRCSARHPHQVLASPLRGVGAAILLGGRTSSTDTAARMQARPAA